MEAKIKVLIGLVVALILIANLGPTALSGLFNSTAFQCVGGNCSVQTGVPAWAVTVLGILGVVAFIFLILKIAQE